MPHIEKLTFELPDDSAQLIRELVLRLGGKILEEEDELLVVPPPPDHEWPGRMCKGLRCRANLTIEDVAESLQIPRDHLVEFENFQRQLSPEDTKKLSALLGCTLDDLSCKPKEA